MARGFSDGRVIAVGYSANAPALFRGAGATFLSPRLVGVFADVKTSGASPAGRSNFMPDWTVDQARNEFGDFAFSSKDHWLVVNGGLTRVIGPDVAIYAGAGYARRRAFEQFSDASGGRGELGYYWVEDTEFSGTYLNLLGGVYFRAGRNLMFQFGAEAQPRGMTVGGHYVLPLRR